MVDTKLLIAALFLPLFPLSLLFNTVFDALRSTRLRFILLVAWPQAGVWLLHTATGTVPGWMLGLALFTALLYGFRALVLRELGQWVSFLATSSWAVLWLAAGFTDQWLMLSLFALGFSVPLILLLVLGAELESRFGAAYTGLYNGLGYSMPRLSGILVMTVLAVVATPVFPGFATMLAAFIQVTEYSLLAGVILALVWLCWGWAAVRLTQGFVIGDSSHSGVQDISSGLAWLYAVILVGLALCGINMTGGLS